MPPTIVEEICANADAFETDMIISFCHALKRLRSSGFEAEADIIENLVSLLFLKLLDIYSPTNTYI